MHSSFSTEPLYYKFRDVIDLIIQQTFLSELKLVATPKFLVFSMIDISFAIITYFSVVTYNNAWFS